MSSSHAPSPELLTDEMLLTMVEGVGSLTYRRLIEAFGDAASILRASKGELRRIEGVSEKTATAIATARTTLSPDDLLRACAEARIGIVSIRDARYPAALRSIYDPPPLLFLRGEIRDRDAFAVAVIGTRRMSAYGRRMAVRLTESLAGAGVTIVSGLAAGIDGVAHRAALDVGGRTIAVLGSGHRRLFPAEHGPLAEEIADSGRGAVLSEFPPFQEPRKWTFPQRNRIVSGLALGVLVVEAPLASGTMITARLAGEQGRSVFAVPGPADQEGSRGCNHLIRDGAILVETAEDVLEQLGPFYRPLPHPSREEPIRHPAELALNAVERQVLQCVPLSATAIQSIVDRSGLAVHQVLAALGVLETQGLIRFESRTHVARL